jgi:hypothetical protein
MATSCRWLRLRACYHGQVSRRPARKSRTSKLCLLPHRSAYRVNLCGGSFPFGRLFFVFYPLLGRKLRGGTAQYSPGSPRHSDEMTYPPSTFSRTLISSYTYAYFSMKSSAKTATTPVHLLRSGWDDDLDLVSPVSRVPSISLSLFKKTGSTCSTPSPPPPDDEARFTQPTVHYLSSGAAQQLRLPPVINPQDYTPFVSPPTSNRPPVQSLTIPKAALDAESIVSASPTGSIFSADTWPKPPLTIPSPESPPVLAAIADLSRPSSPLSVRSSLGSTIVDALGAIPAHLRDAPFNVYGPGVAAVPHSRQPRSRTEHRSPTHRGSRKNDAIYMTVVHETDIGP